MRDSLKHISTVRPLCIVLENVLGIQDKPNGDDSSALEMVCSELKAFGYHVKTVQMSLDTWVSVNRDRTANGFVATLASAPTHIPFLLVFVTPHRV